MAGTLTIPLYEGGRIHGDIQVATATLREREAELEDLRGQTRRHSYLGFCVVASPTSGTGASRAA